MNASAMQLVSYAYITRPTATDAPAKLSRYLRAEFADDEVDSSWPRGVVISVVRYIGSKNTAVN